MIEYDKSSSRFQVSYQAPFGGLDSSAYASAIDPRNFAAIVQGINNANYLSPVSWKSVISQALASGAGNFLGYIPVTAASYIGYIVTDSHIIQLTADGAGGVTYTTYGPYTPAVTTYGHFSFQVISKYIIWTTETWNEIWSFDTSAKTINRLTNYVGGGILGVVDDQLVNLGGVSNLDGQVPYRISWSAPGQYGQFQPYDVGSNTGSYAAGFNDLPDTSDILTGIITVGTVAYLFRAQGITQMNPTGSGAQPFSFNHLWASQLGIGSVFPDSISQYGSMGAFVSDSGIYTLGISGLQEISGQAKDLLFGQINQIPKLATSTKLPKSIVAAVCVPYLLDHPAVYYVLGIATSLTSAPSGSSPSVNTYQLYAIDLNGNYACYNLGTQNVAPNSSTPATFAVGDLAFINRSFSSAPSPVPPAPPSYPNWANTTFYTPYNAWTLYLPNSSPATQPYHAGGFYKLITGGLIYTATGQPPTVATPALFTQVTVGTAVFEYRGGVWAANTGVQLNQFTGLQVGISPNLYNIVYVCTKAGTTGGSQTGWSQNPGDTIIDGNAQWMCIGPASTTLTSENTPGGATNYNVTPTIQILDPSNYLQQNQNSTVNNYQWTHGARFAIIQYDPMPGGFSQTAAPAWNDTTGGATNETKTLSGPVPAATWTCLGPKPVPVTSLVGSNVAAVVPLFIAINNGILGSGASITGVRLSAPNSTDAATFTFRKEQMRFGYKPTVSKVGFLAALIDTTQPGTIAVSVDGGLSFTAFPVISIQPGVGNPGNGIIDNVYSDAVQTLERPQLAVKLTNVKVAEAWYQGTLADYAVI